MTIVLAGLTACGTLRAINNTEEGSGAEAMTVWQRWVDSDGDIAVATTWERKVKDGVTVAEIEQAFTCLLYTSPSPRDQRGSRMPSSA